MRMPTDKFQILAPPSAYAALGIFIANAMADALQGAWFFNKAPGETDADAADRCSFDWTPGSANQASDRNWGGAGGKPQFFTDYALARNDQCLITRRPDFTAATGGCTFALVRTEDTNTGVTSPQRGGIVGNNWTSAGGGYYQELSAWSNGSVRTVVMGGSPPTVALCMGTSDLGGIQKWKLYFGRVSPTHVKTTILSGTAGVPNPTEVALPGGFYVPSVNPCVLLGKAPGSNYDMAITKRVAFVLRFGRVPTTQEYDAIAAQCRDIISETGIIEMAVTP